jgi:hypothetical protein
MFLLAGFGRQSLGGTSIMKRLVKGEGAVGAEGLDVREE